MAVAAVPPSPTGARMIGAGILAGLLLVVAGLLFAAVYYVLPSEHHYGALLGIGVLALFFSLGSYLAESLSRNPVAQRSLAWGFFGMGFSMLLITIALGRTYGALTVLWQLVGLLLTVVALVLSLAFIIWRMRATVATARRLSVRASVQRQQAASALDYPAAKDPSVPKVPSAPRDDPLAPRDP